MKPAKPVKILILGPLGREEGDLDVGHYNDYSDVNQNSIFISEFQKKLKPGNCGLRSSEGVA